MSQFETTMYKTREAAIPLNAKNPGLLGHAVDLDVLYRLEEAQVAGEADLVVELMDLYTDDAPSKMAEIRKALGGAEGASLKRAAHNLEGSSATLGAKQMAVLCRDLQHLDHGNSIEHSRTLVSRLEDEFSQVLLAFAAERQRRFA